MKKMFQKLAILLTVFTTFGCGAIIHGTKAAVSITAPSDATIRIDGRIIKGSQIIKLSRDRSYGVIMEKNGQTTICGTISNTLSVGIVIGDVFLGIIILPFFYLPGIIDAATGAWYNLEPEEIMCRE